MQIKTTVKCQYTPTPEQLKIKTAEDFGKALWPLEPSLCWGQGRCQLRLNIYACPQTIPLLSTTNTHI